MMCRLCAITATNLECRNLIFHEMMTLGRHDENQCDGYGVWGRTPDKYHVVFKQHYSYDYADLAMYSGFSQKSIIAGHVRKASPGTEVSQRASHPFMVTKDNLVEFIAAHNGKMTGIPHYTAEIRSDSFVAFQELQKSLGEDRVLTKGVFERWLSLFEEDSAFCFMITQRNRLFVIRGASTRTMSLARLGNGYVFHTNPDILARLGQYTKSMLGVEIGEIFSVGDNTLITAAPGSSELEVEDLEYELKPSRVYTYNTYPKVYEKKEEAKKEVIPKEETRTDIVLSKTSSTMMLKEVRELLNPMRFAAIINYIEYVLKLENVSWVNLTVEQRLQFIDHVKNTPLTKIQRRMIDRWNDTFDKRDDAAWQEIFFGTSPFWLRDPKTLFVFFNEVRGKQLSSLSDFDIMGIKTFLEKGDVDEDWH